MFDRLLLLGEGGQTLYFGDIGPDASTLIDYFESNGAPLCQPGRNVAEWMIEITNKNTESGLHPRDGDSTDWAVKWDESLQKRRVLSHLNALKSTHSKSSQVVEDVETAYAAPVLQQISLISKRALLEQWRNPFSLLVKIIVFVGNVSLMIRTSLGSNGASAH